MAQGRRPLAQTALLIAAPLVLLAYAGIGGWLWWTDQQEKAAPPPAVSEAQPETAPEAATVAEEKPPAEPAAEEPKTEREPEPEKEVAKPESEPAAKPAEAPEQPAEPAEKAPDPEPQQVAEPEKPETEPQVTPDSEKIEPEQPDQTATESTYRPEPLPPSSPLKPAPDPALTVRGKYGPLPQRADDGREAWQVYARPFDRKPDARVIALVITELGLAEQPTLSAIQDLPGEVTLAFTPYSRRLQEWVPAARAAGHEVLLEVPMEPRNMEFQDPGDKALLTTNDPEVNLDRLEWVMSRATGYVGLTSFMGTRLTVSERDLRPVLDAMAARGLAYVDLKKTTASIADKLARDLGMPAAAADREIDLQAAREPIDRRLGQLEQIALSRGYAVGFAQAYPVTIERLRKWIPEMKKRGFELAPVSAVVSR